MKLFFRMSRPNQLVSIVMVFTWGVLLALARGFLFSWPGYACALIAGLLVSISIHYTNEYADVETDRLTTRTPFSGGSGALPEAGYSPSVALIGAGTAAILGLVIATASVIARVLPIHSLTILGIAVLLGWGYSLRPLALAWRGWGELDNAFLGGVLLPIYGYFALSAQMDRFVLGAVVPFGMLAFTNLLATTWADRSADTQVGKFTLATRLPAKRLILLYTLVAGAAYLHVFWLSPYPPLVMWASLIAAPVSAWGLLRYTRQVNPAPSVYAMIAFLTVQLITWAIIVF